MVRGRFSVAIFVTVAAFMSLSCRERQGDFSAEASTNVNAAKLLGMDLKPISAAQLAARRAKFLRAVDWPDTSEVTVEPFSGQITAARRKDLTADSEINAAAVEAPGRVFLGKVATMMGLLSAQAAPALRETFGESVANDKSLTSFTVISAGFQMGEFKIGLPNTYRGSSSQENPIFRMAFKGKQPISVVYIGGLLPEKDDPRLEGLELQNFPAFNDPVITNQFKDRTLTFRTRSITFRDFEDFKKIQSQAWDIDIKMLGQRVDVRTGNFDKYWIGAVFAFPVLVDGVHQVVNVAADGTFIEVQP